MPNTTLDEWAKPSRKGTDPSPAWFQLVIVWPPTDRKPGSSTMVSGVTLPASTAAAPVMTLKIDPGGKASATGLMRQFRRGKSAKRLGS